MSSIQHAHDNTSKFLRENFKKSIDDPIVIIIEVAGLIDHKFLR
jgi:hypothetical protein